MKLFRAFYWTRGDAAADAMALDVAVVMVEEDEDRVLLLKYSAASLRTSSIPSFQESKWRQLSDQQASHPRSHTCT